MNLITRSLLNDFKQMYGFEDDLESSVIFEHFGSYCVLSKHYSEEFDTTSLHTGGGGDGSIDGLGIIIDGELFSELEEVEEYLEKSKRVEVEFIFIQSKARDKVDSGEISKFLFGIQNVFESDPAKFLIRGDKINYKISIIQSIYSKYSSKFGAKNPTVRAYYVYSGQWENDHNINVLINERVQFLKETDLFSDVIFETIDAKKIQELYSYARNSISRSIQFERRVSIPSIVTGVEEAYLGILPIKEFLKLLTDDNGTIIKFLFYDNVRDYQGNNSVNNEIQKTIESDQHLFALLNNGVTIVTEQISNKVGDQITLEGFQIVNGCQTSHVLYENRNKITDGVYIPVRIIVSPDDEVKNKIIKATNRQTPVKDEELIAITDFQKELEKYYAACPLERKLFYQRRSQQYRSSRDVERSKIVTIPVQIRCFSSMFLDKPHLAGRYYGNLLKEVQGKIFCENHKHIAYYLCAYALYRFERFAAKKIIDEKYKNFKFIILMILRLMLGGKNPPTMSSKKFERYCQDILDVISNEDGAKQSFEKACFTLDQVLKDDFDRSRAKVVSLVQEIRDGFPS
jgi:hypothetical protein